MADGEAKPRVKPRAKSENRSKYTVIQKIASGGMAEIYVAKVSGLAGSDRLCVLKKILPVAAENPKAVQMFLDEARIAATLQHENIVQMYEVGTVGRDYFIAMEYLHGEDARMLLTKLYLEKKRLPLEHALQIVIGMCRGLHYAHDKKDINGQALNIVHRDISPHNLFVTYDGGVKVLDFGIALAANRSHHTRIDVLKGKVAYMSPEQCHRLDLDRRSDIYSAGIVLFELTTGLKMNPGDDDFAIMKRTCEGPIPKPSEDVEDYPEALEEIVMKALAKEPEDRFQTAAEMQEALEDFAHENHLRLSSLRLANYVRELFHERYEAWQQGMEKGTDIKEMILARNTESGSELEIEDLAGANSMEIMFDQTPSAPALRKKPLTIEPGPNDIVQPPRLGAFAVFMALLAIGAAVIAGYFLITRAGKKDDRVTANPTTDPSTADSDAGATATQPQNEPPDAAIMVILPGRVELVTKPSHATIIVDGTRYPEKSPTVIENLVAGDHEIVIKRHGYVDRTETLTIEADKTQQLSVTLDKSESTEPKRPPDDLDGETDEGPGPDQPMIGTLKVTTTPTCRIFVDGAPQGTTAYQGSLAAGKHKIRLVNDELEVDVTKTIQVYAGTVVSRHYIFERQ